ncbi:MAG: hypothetical protein JKX73_04340 [Flavobacteriales bacterium]|nr:hypothetical protein [Flavobacteriales bacterium]
MEEKTPLDPTLKVIDTRTATIQKRADGIVCVRTKNDVNVTTEDSIRTHDVIRSLANGGKVPLLVIAGSGGTMDDEVKERWLDRKKDRPVMAEAIVTGTLAHNILVNFSISFYRLDRPMKMFMDEVRAVIWLKGRIEREI